MSLLARLRELEEEIYTAIRARKAPSVESVRLLDSVVMGLLKPDPHEEEAVKLVVRRISRRLALGALDDGADEDSV